MKYSEYTYDCPERLHGIIDTPTYTYADLTIIPAVVSDIDSRKTIDIYDENGMEPIFTAPMASVVNEKNFDIWQKNKINAIIPRTVPYSIRFEHIQKGNWVALSKKEFKKLFVSSAGIAGSTYKVCIDLANGHMESLYDDINAAKEISHQIGYTLVIMTGNIALPQTYQWICENVELDYIRLSVGSGDFCLTAPNTGVHYGIASLIDDCAAIRDEIEYEYECIGPEGAPHFKSLPKIVADGSIKNYSDINKALALGADYVMIGSLFTGLLESAADMQIESKDQIKYPAYYMGKGEAVYNVNYDDRKSINVWNGNTEEEKIEFIRSMKSINKKGFGMSTKEAQRLILAALEEPVIADRKDLKTSEGCTKFIPCKYTISQWIENMEDYLKSAMSYCDAHNLKEFQNHTYLRPRSVGVMMTVNK